MTATANIQNDKNTAAKKTNKIMEDGEMNNDNIINMVTRLSNGFRRSNISKLAAGAAIGLALTTGVAMSIRASAPSGVLATNLNNDVSIVYGIPDSASVAGYADMSEENLELVTSSLVAGYADMSEENREIVPASFSVAGYDDMSEEIMIHAVEIGAGMIENTGTFDWSDYFSLVYGTPDDGQGIAPVSKIAPARVTENTGTFDWSDDFSLVYGTPGDGQGTGSVSKIAPARVTPSSKVSGDTSDAHIHARVSSSSVAGYADMSEDNLEIVG